MTLNYQPIQSIEIDEQGIGRFRVDPLTRTASPLTLDALIDFADRRVISAQVERRAAWRPARMVIGRPPTDAAPLVSRSRGTGSAAHAISSVMALEMAYQSAPPPLAIMTRGLGAAAELIAAHIRQLFLTAGPDYSEAAISRTNLKIWRDAQAVRAPGKVFHGYGSIADIMRGMNPVGGHLYRESLHLMRVACEIATLLFGKYPHPSAIFPAGMGIVASKELYQQVLARFNQLLDYAKKVAAIWDDLVGFFYHSDERFGRVGQSEKGFLSLGLWDDPEACDGTMANASQWGLKRYSTPGMVIDRKLTMTSLTGIRTALEEGRREHLESGPLARLSVTALGGKFRNEFIECQNKRDEWSLMFDLPEFETPAIFLRWQFPARANALERNRARAYQIGYASLVGLTYLRKAFESLNRGEKAMSIRYRTPIAASGSGFWEEALGSVRHEVTIAARRIDTYRVITPDSWLQAETDSPRRLGAIEQALVNTPLVEEFATPETFTGIDLLRVIRSFDA
jgi:hydrogenase large subunit